MFNAVLNAAQYYNVLHSYYKAGTSRSHADKGLLI